MKIILNKKELPVSGFYPYRYPDGKMVLRFTINQKDMSFNDIYAVLHENEYPIEYYETEHSIKPECIYYGYSEFTCNYKNGKYDIEQVSPSHINSAVELLLQEREEREEIIKEQQNTIALLSQCIIELTEDLYQK